MWHTTVRSSRENFRDQWSNLEECWGPELEFLSSFSVKCVVIYVLVVFE